MELLKLLSTNEVVAQVISFLLLMFLLRIFAWKRILKLLDDRKERIASEFKRIDEAKEEIVKVKAAYDAQLAKIDETAQAKIQAAVDEGRKIAGDVRQKAHEDAREIIDNAKQNIQEELSKAKEELKERIVDLTMSVAESVIQEKLSQKDDERLVKEFLEKLDKEK
jgi:F-type H+-transporting ATPase subunit b